MPQSLKSHTLRRMVLTIILPAYLAPTIVVSIVAKLIPDQRTGRALGHAAFTTIAIPSALTALVVTLFFWRYSVPLQATSKPIHKSAAASAAVSAILALALSAVLVASDQMSARLIPDAVPSALLSGAIAASQTIRGLRRNLPISSA